MAAFLAIAIPFLEYEYSFPFDKNNFTLPLVGETILILQVGTDFFYLPYSNTLYPNYRQDYKTTEKFSDYNIQKEDTSDKNQKYKTTQQTGTSTTQNSSEVSSVPEYSINEKIKFLKPRQGDTILSGRVGNTIRFSEFFLTEDGKTSTPGIYLRNKQNPELDSKVIGTLVDEDINKDGTSIYITSGKVDTKLKPTVTKQKIAFKNFQIPPPIGTPLIKGGSPRLSAPPLSRGAGGIEPKIHF